MNCIGKIHGGRTTEFHCLLGAVVSPLSTWVAESVVVLFQIRRNIISQDQGCMWCRGLCPWSNKEWRIHGL